MTPLRLRHVAVSRPGVLQTFVDNLQACHVLVDDSLLMNGIARCLRSRFQINSHVLLLKPTQALTFSQTLNNQLLTTRPSVQISDVFRRCLEVTRSVVAL